MFLPFARYKMAESGGLGYVRLAKLGHVLGYRLCRKLVPPMKVETSAVIIGFGSKCFLSASMTSFRDLSWGFAGARRSRSSAKFSFPITVGKTDSCLSSATSLAAKKIFARSTHVEIDSVPGWNSDRVAYIGLAAMIPPSSPV